jgi:hypothetical protein
MKNILVAALVAAFAAVCANAQGPPPGASSSTAGGGSGLPAGPTTPNSRAQICTETPSGGVAPSNCTWGLAGDFPPDRPSGESSYTFAATDIGTSVRETNPAGETFTIPDGNTAGFVPPVNIGIIVRGGASTLQRQTSSQVACTPNGALANSCTLAAGAQYILKETSDFNYTLSASGDAVTQINVTPNALSSTGRVRVNSANGGFIWYNGAGQIYAAAAGAPNASSITCTNQVMASLGFNNETCSTIPAAALPNGIWDFNQAAQSQVVVSGTEYYITNSNLNMPATYLTPIAAGTTLKWHVAMTKTAAGTGTFQILFKDGTNGTTADATDATVTIGTQTAAVDDLDFDLVITFTSATAYYYSLAPHQAGPSAAGFGLVYPATAAQFSGTVTGLTTTTANNKYGLSFKATTGTPTIVVNQVQGQALGVN